MSGFTGPLRLRHGGVAYRRWTLLRPLAFEEGFEGSARWITVPAGFITDGATVPQVFWWLFPMTGSYLRAAVIHDFLLTRLEAGTPHPLAPTRADCDRIFLQAMRACGTPLLSRLTLFLAVRAYGIAKAAL